MSYALVSCLGDTERSQYVAAVVKGVFHTHSKQLGVGKLLPGLPDYDSPTFPDWFIEYCRSSEWREYWKETVRHRILFG